jgi:hypothetical protein
MSSLRDDQKGLFYALANELNEDLPARPFRVRFYADWVVIEHRRPAETAFGTLCYAALEEETVLVLMKTQETTFGRPGSKLIWKFNLQEPESLSKVIESISSFSLS